MSKHDDVSGYRFDELLQQGKFKNALDFLKSLSEEQQLEQLKKVYDNKSDRIDMANMKTMSVLTRKLKPGYSYNDFYQAWLPPSAKELSQQDSILKDYFNMTGCVMHAINIQDPSEIISIGCMPVDKNQLAEVIKLYANTEQQRHDSIGDVADKIGETKMCEIVDVILK